MKIQWRSVCAAACGVALICGCDKTQEAAKTPGVEGKPARTTADAKSAGPILDAVPKAGVAEKLETVLVTVNGKTFTRGMAMGVIQEQMRRRGVPPEYAEQYLSESGDAMMDQAVEQFISQTLVQSEVERRAESVTDAEIATVIDRISGTLPPEMTLTNALATQGMTMDMLRAEIVRNERTRKLFDAEVPAMSNAVTDADVEAFYKKNEKEAFTAEESVEVRHILLGCEEGKGADARAAAKANAESVRAQLVAGADFAKLAAATSTCPSKAKGGDLGLVRRGQMVPAFEQAAFGQEVGAIGPVVETPFGYHVVQVTKKVPAGVTPLAEVSSRIREYLVEQSRGKRVDAYLKGLRAKAKIVYPAGRKVPAGLPMDAPDAAN